MADTQPDALLSLHASLASIHSQTPKHPPRIDSLAHSKCSIISALMRFHRKQPLTVARSCLPPPSPTASSQTRPGRLSCLGKQTPHAYIPFIREAHHPSTATSTFPSEPAPRLHLRKDIILKMSCPDCLPLLPKLHLHYHHHPSSTSTSSQTQTTVQYPSSAAQLPPLQPSTAPHVAG